MFDLSGKVALVTGASGGIGGAIAEALHTQGAAVALSGRRVDALEALAARLGEGAHAVPCDLADRDALATLPERAAGGGGRARHPRPLRRHYPRRSRAPHEGRGLAGGPGCQSQRRFRARPRLPARHDPPALGAARLHHLGGGHDRQCRAGELCRLQGRPRGHGEGARRRGRPRAASPPTASLPASSRRR